MTINQVSTSSDKFPIISYLCRGFGLAILFAAWIIQNIEQDRLKGKLADLDWKAGLTRESEASMQMWQINYKNYLIAFLHNQNDTLVKRGLLISAKSFCENAIINLQNSFDIRLDLFPDSSKSIKMVQTQLNGERAQLDSDYVKGDAALFAAYAEEFTKRIKGDTTPKHFFRKRVQIQSKLASLTLSFVFYYIVGSVFLAASFILNFKKETE